jgi:hypothetical protein
MPTLVMIAYQDSVCLWLLIRHCQLKSKKLTNESSATVMPDLKVTHPMTCQGNPTITESIQADYEVAYQRTHYPRIQ